MEFAQVVVKRRMVRHYLDEPVDEAFLRRALDNATRAPSAGFTQGWSFLVLRTPADVDLFWESTVPQVEAAADAVRRPNPWLDGMRTAPAIIVALASESAYRTRYSESDKDGAGRRSADMPWWQIDAAMACLLILQTATDESLGACFFGVPHVGVAPLRQAFAIPDDFSPVGAITLGHPANTAPTGSPTRRTRRPLSEVAHDGSWGSRFGEPR